MAKIACNPATWGNARTEDVLDDVENAGYSGIEASEYMIEAFARQPGKLRALLDERTMQLVSVPFAGYFFERSEFKEERERLRRRADFAAAVQEGSILLFRTVAHPARRDMVAGEPPLLPLEPDRMARLADTLNEFSDICMNFGIRAAFQHRVGTFIETPDEFQEVLARTEPTLLWASPDTGHWVYAGGDVHDLVREYRRRTILWRLKDLDQPVFDRTRLERKGFQSFLSAAGFKELGEGTLPLEAAFLPVAEADYGGWVTVELERTRTSAPESARTSRHFLRTRLHW